MFAGTGVAFTTDGVHLSEAAQVKPGLVIQACLIKN
jgi:hypothetical protein